MSNRDMARFELTGSFLRPLKASGRAAVYSPYHQVNYTGSSVSGTGCTQLIGRYINFSGSATFNHGCSGDGTLDPVAGWQLVE